MMARVFAVTAVGVGLVVLGCQSRGGDVSGVGNSIISGVRQTVNRINPDDVRGATTELDEPEEIELGRAVSSALGSRYKLLRDDPLTRYVALVGNAVAQQSDRPDLRYYFGVLDTTEVNAFAAPGGYVFITSGTLLLMRDEATLAAVLAHEIGHIALRHHVETIKTEKQAALTKGIGASALRVGSGYIRGAAGSAATAPLNSPLMNVLADGAFNAVLKGFSRAEEEQADAVGVKYAARAGYDPAGLRDFLRAVEDGGKQPAKSGFVAKFTATHPGTDERLRDQDNQLKTMPAGGRRAATRFEQRAMKPPSPPAR